MDRQKVTCLLTYFASGAQACHKPAIPLDSAPNKQVLPQGRFSISNNPQVKISCKMNILLKQEGRESYGDEAAEGATAILHGEDEFVGVNNKFEAARAEESTSRARSQRAGNLFRNATGTTNEREEDKGEDNDTSNRTQPVGNLVEQATGEVKTIFGGGNGWGNKSAPPSSPRMLGIPRGGFVMIEKQAAMFPVGRNSPIAGTTAQNLHRAMMGENTKLHNTVLGGNRMGGSTGTASAPVSGKQQCTGKGSTGWSVLTGAMKMFGRAATMQEFSKNY